MRTKTTLLALSTTVTALSLLLSGCSGTSSTSSGGGGSTDQLKGVSITVGSKDFTENILLGEMFAQALKNKGASVSDKTDLGGTSVNRKALTSNQIDVYPEYTGTGWTVNLGHDNPSQDPQTLYKDTAQEDLQKNNIKWIGMSPFNDTYGFAANGDLAKKHGAFDFQSMADYLKANSSATVCMESEFPDRPDGLILWEKATGYKIPRSQTKILDTGLIYTETAKGSCQFGEVFTTDGRIQALNLSLVEDPGVMILYNVSFTMNNDIYKAHPEVYDSIATTILKPLENAKMAELNAKVDVDGQTAAAVATEYLKSIGLA